MKKIINEHLRPLQNLRYDWHSITRDKVWNDVQYTQIDIDLWRFVRDRFPQIKSDLK